MGATPEEVLDYHARLAAVLESDAAQVTSFFTYFIGDAWEKNHDRAAGMFYPIIRRSRYKVTEEDGRKLAHILGDSLQDAVTYQVTSEMVQVMRSIWEKTQAGKIFHLDRREMPAESGFAWLDDPWQTFDVRGDSDRVRAVSWEYTTAWVRKENFPHDTPWAQPSVRLSMWTLAQDDREQDRLPGYVLDRVERQLGKLTLLHTAVVPFDVRLGIPSKEEVDGSADSMLGLVHMLWMFLGMEIVTTRRHVPARAFRRRALRSILHGEVHVVLLRRLAHPETGEDVTHREVDWTCQWVVQGHWRHWEKPDFGSHRAVVLYGEEASDEHFPECEKQLKARPHRHCVQCGGPVSWVKPYIKGPDGRPLKVSRTLMRLAR
jgi:hypothetical protein